MDRTPITIAGQRWGQAHPLESLAAQTDASAAGLARAASLYVHVPFCLHKCHYCDFYSLVDTQDRQEAFTDRLIEELTALAPFADRLETVYVGGGTPTLLRADLWRRLLAALHDRMPVAPEAEFTVECNPETASAELMDVLAAGGVNRISVGAQSFHRRHLETLQRLHNPDNVARALELARRAGIGRQSVDLILAIPGQRLEEWAQDLDCALSLGVEHLSCYALTYEPNTALTARLRLGQVQPVDEDLEADMLELTVRRLRSAGLDRYEVSNFARPGRACRHNLAYWRQQPWLAAGPSASGHLAGWRWKNTPRLDTYLHGFRGAGLAPVVDVEPPDPRRALAERIMTGLRLAEGLAIDPLLTDAAELDEGLPERLRERAELAEARGQLVQRQGRWCLTDAGMLLADGIAAEWMATI
ncbi:MAG: putative oxygen-independent coproporphyrinogen III oxidase HemN [Phycisphaerales bacterium]|nr:MAG: putative oxygen-independent coproporphyrinogen III oxidase HemN [Phycisphaerales bacterium]